MPTFSKLNASGGDCGPHLSNKLLFALVTFLVPISSELASTPHKDAPTFTTPLATGVRLDAEGDFIDLGSMPLGMAVAPGGNRVVAVLSGWREQGIQVVDLESKKVLQTIPQEAAFYGAAFAADGKVKAHFEIEPLENINSIFDRMRKGQIQGRIVMSVN